MFGLSGEHLIILAGILIIFGPSRLPAAGAALGKTIRNFKDHWNGIVEPTYRRLPEPQSKEVDKNVS
jgi:TatA/E family protein of Tat protein translocase